MDNATVNEQPVAAPTGSDYASLTQAERHARYSHLWDLEEAERVAAEKRPGITHQQFRKMLRDYENSRQGTV